MSYNSNIEQRIDFSLNTFPAEIKNNITKKKMFGGLSFLYKGKMTVGIIKDDLAVRVISDKMSFVLNHEFVRPMDFTKKPMKEFLYVSSKGFKTEEQLQEWIELGIEHAQSKLKNTK